VKCILLSLVVLLLCAGPAAAQQNGIRGSIKDMAGHAVPYANIVVNDTASRNLAFVMSDTDGHFSIPALEKGTAKVFVEVTAVGYAAAVKAVSLDTVRHLSIQMEASTIQLEEIKVKVRAYTDTLAIDTEQMNLSKNSTLRDILNKTDGLIVSEEGGISYQGKQINKILINGKEVFINQNKVALDNLKHEIMEKVQVINNHKDKFTLDFNNIKDPVINIDTKPEFKGVVKGELEGSYGAANSFGANGKGFYFSDRLNVFATTHTNNTGQKELSERDVLAPANRHVSATMRRVLAPFFQADYQTRRNFASNSSATARREGEKSKSGLVLYHGNIRTEKIRRERVFIADTLTAASSRTDEEGGNFFAATAEYNRLIPGAVLKNTWSAIIVQRQSSDRSTDTLFVPVQHFFGINTRERPKSFAFTDALRLTKSLGGGTILDLGAEYYHERDDRDFETRLSADPQSDIAQDGRFSKQQIEAFGSLKHRFGKMAARAGMGIRQNEETGLLENRRSPADRQRLSRSSFTAEMPLRLEGTAGKLSYDLTATPALMHVGGAGSRGLFKTSQRFVYDVDVHENIRLQADRGYSFYNLNALFDTVLRRYNQRIVTAPDLVHRQSLRDEVSAGWSKINGKRGVITRFEYAFRNEKRFMQSILDSISGNVFHYSNRIFHKRRTHTVNGGMDKTFYLGSAYHRLSISGDLHYTASRYPTFLNGRPARAAMDAWHPTVGLDFLPRNFFVRELAHRVGWDHFVFLMDGERITRQTVLANRFSMRGHGRKTDWRFHFEHYRYDVQGGDRFGFPDCSFSVKFEASDSVLLSVDSRALMTLFEWNSYSSVSTRFDGNTLSQTSIDNNLGYLLFGVSLKI